MPRLTVVNGPYRGQRLALASSDVVIGRDAGCDLILPHDWVSRRHCRLFQQSNAWLIEDLGSCNGLCVNGVRVAAPVPLSADDLIAMGPSVLRFEVPHGGAETEGEREPMDVATAPPGQGAGAGTGGEGAGPAADPIRVALAPDVHFAVTLAPVLKTKQEVTQYGKVSLRALARRGVLAADAAFDGRLSGQFGERQFLILDSYDLTGHASVTLRVGLLLPKKTRRRQREWVDAYVQSKIEYPLSVHAVPGPSVLDSSNTQVRLGPPIRTIWASEGGADPDSTGRLASWAGALGRRLPYDLPPEALSARLTELCESYIATERGIDRLSFDLIGVLKQHCSEAVGRYRDWYRKRWQDQTQFHDSQLPVGELHYEFDVQGKPLDLPRARTLSSVYRWL